MDGWQGVLCHLCGRKEENSRMKQKGNNERRPADKGAKPRISQSIWEFAGEFICLGGTLKQRESQLNAACSAWNIASNQPELRKKHLDHFLREYKKHNPGSGEEQVAAIRGDMETLIERKLSMFPSDLRQIVNARIVKVGDREHIEVAAAAVQ